MASIDVGGGHGRKKAIDSELPLVPFIDLLLCCVMFLLVTAVWNEIASVDAHLPGAGIAGAALDRAELSTKLRALLALDATLHDASVGADDGVSYAELVDVMDIAAGAGFSRITVSDASL